MQFPVRVVHPKRLSLEAGYIAVPVDCTKAGVRDQLFCRRRLEALQLTLQEVLDVLDIVLQSLL